MRVMEKFCSSYFFDLSVYAHASLFDGCVMVWQALANLTPYLDSLELGSLSGEISDKAHIVNPETITIGEGSVVEPGAYIKGPCLIGNNCTIRHGAYIRGHVVTGDGCVIGHDTEIKNTIMLDGAKAPHFAYVGDSVLGNRVNLGAGTVCANLKLKGDEVYVSVEGKRVGTGLRKLGLIAGDDVQTGCHTVTNPGTLLGPRVLCYPTLNVGGFVPVDQIVKPKT